MVKKLSEYRGSRGRIRKETCGPDHNKQDPVGREVFARVSRGQIMVYSDLSGVGSIQGLSRVLKTVLHSL